MPGLCTIGATRAQSQVWSKPRRIPAGDLALPSQVRVRKRALVCTRCRTRVTGLLCNWLAPLCVDERTMQKAWRAPTSWAYARLGERLGLDAGYIRNWLVYTSLQQPTFLSEEFPSPNQRAVLPRDQCLRWREPEPPRPVEHPHQPGLWLLRGVLSPERCAAVASAVWTLTGGNAVMGHGGVPVRSPCEPAAFERAAAPASTTFEWFEYWPARYMVPLQPEAGVDAAFAANELAGLHSHNCTDAREWPLLGEVPGEGGEALRLLERTPAERIGAFASRPPLFVQLQALQRGAVIGAHVDEPGVGGRAIATTVIAGASEVRVGGVAFVVREGDMYALTGPARDDVDHEVYSGTEDRLSVTVRYGDRIDDS